MLLDNDPDGCTVATTDDNFVCAAPPLSGTCPSLATDLPAGAWTVVVAHRNACAAGPVEYRLSVAGAAGPLLLESDDLERLRRHPTQVHSAVARRCGGALPSAVVDARLTCYHDGHF
jgi:hypothetical protein